MGVPNPLSLYDVFLDEAVSYSPNAQPIAPFTVDDPLKLLGAIGSTLIAAGWTEGTPVNSQATQVRIGFAVPVDPTPGGVPVQLPSSYCGAAYGLEYITFFSVGDVNFTLYPPSQVIPPVCGGPFPWIWVPMGTTNNGTAVNMAAAIQANTDFNCTFVGTSPPGWIVGAGFEFLFTSKHGTDADQETLNVGTGPPNSSGGSHNYQSQMLNGLTITVTLTTNVHGNYTDSLIFTVSASNGGAYFQEFYPGEYKMFANGYQFVIWPHGGGTQLSNIGPNKTFIENGFICMMLVSMLDNAPPLGYTDHTLTHNPVIVIGSSNQSGLLGTGINDQQLQQELNWPASLATGLGNTLHSTSDPANVFDGIFHVPSVDFGPSILFRGIRGTSLVSLSNAPFTQPAYVALSNNPILDTDTGGTTSIIAGKLWDMVVVSQSFANPGIDDTMKFDGHNWNKIANDVMPGDLFGSLWVRSISSAPPPPPTPTPYSGEAYFSGNAVVWFSGDSFNASMTALVVNGVTYAITKFYGNDYMLLSPATPYTGQLEAWIAI